MKNLRGLLLTFTFVLIWGLSSAKNDTINYTVTFPNAVHHECMVTIVFYDLEEKEVNLVMSNTSPGRYADHFFAKNVYNVEAFNLLDQPVDVERVSPSQWRTKPHNGYLRITYTLYANFPDGTYSGIDRSFAHFNMPSAFIWVKELKDHPVKISFEYHDKRDWKIATQLKELDSITFFSPDLPYFMDSPTVLSDHSLQSFEVGNNEESSKIKLVISPDQNDESENKYLEMVKKVVMEQKAVFGEFPDYDYDEYTFLCSYGPEYHGDGMEHRNSTMITSSSPLEGNELSLIGTVSHEFFHCWNVERLRPASLEPFDFTEVNMSGELWFAEGFTSYYGDLTLGRSGVYSIDLFLQKMAGRLNYVINSPGTGKFSPVEMSKRAPFVDASSFIDETNFTNTFTSYYPYGAVLAMALDLDIRSRFTGKDLDGYMQYLWNRYGKTEIPYANNDLQTALIHYTGDDSFATSFFDKYIFGTEVPEFDDLLRKAGFALQLKDSAQTDLLTFDYAYDEKSNGIRFLSAPKERSTFYLAGLNQGDIILMVDDMSFATLESFRQYLATKNPGDRLTIKYLHFGNEYDKLTVVKRSNYLEIVDLAQRKGELPEGQRAFREHWLSTKVK